MAKIRINQGGLMRCCIATVVELDESGRELKENEIFNCKYCKGRMKYQEGRVIWYPEPEIDQTSGKN